MNAVTVKNLSKLYGNFKAVDDISFSVRRGEIFGFLGANGAGKSTTIKILCGIQPLTFGETEVLGIDVSKHPKAVKQKIGYMSQKFSLYNDLTVEENINFFAGIRSITGKELEKRKAMILKMAELEGKEKIQTRDLPGGWKQKLAIGCSIMHNPDILFLDEPTAGVDPETRRLFWEIIYDLQNEGTTIFVTSHYMDEVEQCDRIALMHRGKIAAIGAPDDLKSLTLPGRIVNIQTDNTQKTEKVLANLKEIIQLDTFGRGYHAVTDIKNQTKLKELIVKIASDLKKEKIKILEMGEVPASLEDVFVYLIGSLEEKNHVAKN